jgi:hypothetical protein
MSALPSGEEPDGNKLPMRWRVIEHFPDQLLKANWENCLRDSDYPSHYAGPGFFQEPFFFNRRPFAVVALEGEEVMGALTGVRQEGQVTSGLNVRPQTCIRVGVDRAEVAAALAAGLQDITVSGTRLVQVFTWTPIETLILRGYREREYSAERGVMVLDLDRGPDALFRRFSDNRRTNIRKSLKLGVVVNEATSEREFREFYEIYVPWCGRKGLPCNSWSEMLGALSLREHRRLFVARLNGRMVAGVVVRFQQGGVVEYAANSSIQEDQKLKPNDLLHWRIIEWACREGFRQYSLGGAHLFLRKFGGEFHTTYRYFRDLTWFRRYELAEQLQGLVHTCVQRFPESVRRRVRAALRRLDIA